MQRIDQRGLFLPAARRRVYQNRKNEDVVVFVDRHKMSDDPDSLQNWREQKKTSYTHHKGVEYLEGNIERFD
jgi:hypothetical protein